VITGDFDSLEDSVEKFYSKKLDNFTVDFQHDDDQNSTDFDKAIDVVIEYEKSRKVFSSSTLLNLDDFTSGYSCFRGPGRSS
jgi:thiamine pyrophosphokinase